MLIDHEHRGAQLEAFVAMPEGQVEPRPVVLVAHMWSGRVPFCDEQARAFARLGYVGFALDLYGKGVFGRNVAECSRLMQPFIDDRELLQSRLLAAVEVARGLPMVDAGRVAAVGYCFGGLCVLDLARVSSDVAGVVSFHGLLKPPDNLQADRISARVLVLHGHDDPLVTREEEAGLKEELTRAGADWQYISFGHAMHAFTNPNANDREMGTVYDATAAARAWRYATDFLAETFGGVSA